MKLLITNYKQLLLELQTPSNEKESFSAQSVILRHLITGEINQTGHSLFYKSNSSTSLLISLCGSRSDGNLVNKTK